MKAWHPEFISHFWWSLRRAHVYQCICSPVSIVRVNTFSSLWQNCVSGLLFEPLSLTVEQTLLLYCCLPPHLTGHSKYHLLHWLACCKNIKQNIKCQKISQQFSNIFDFVFVDMNFLSLGEFTNQLHCNILNLDLFFKCHSHFNSTRNYVIRVFKLIQSVK